MRYIDADKLIELANNTKDKTIDANDIARFPIADVRENVRGYLVNIEPSLTLIDAIPTPSGEKALLSMDKSCSKCKTPIPPNICNNVWFKYCPFCGAEMRI